MIKTKMEKEQKKSGGEKKKIELQYISKRGKGDSNSTMHRVGGAVGGTWMRSRCAEVEGLFDIDFVLVLCWKVGYH